MTPEHMTPEHMTPEHMTPEDYLRNAYCIASQSRDSSSQNGSTLVGLGGSIIGTGANNFPIGVSFTRDRSEKRPDKYTYFEHAERNSIYSAARAGNSVYGATMYCPWAACCDCARGIINAGVRVLYMHKERMVMTPKRWGDSVIKAQEMMTEAGIELVFHQGPITDCPDIRVNGELWNPFQPPLEGALGNQSEGMGT